MVEILHAGAEWKSLIDIARERAQLQPQRTAYSFLRDGEADRVAISYETLDRRARALAATIQARATAAPRILLLTPPGIDFVVSAFGSLYAGAVMVPSMAPRALRPQRSIADIRRLVADAGVSFAVTADAAVTHAILDAAPDLAGLHWLALTEVPDGAAARWQRPGLGPDDLAVLQYTSGSTQRPKGVMVSHGNLMANLCFLRDAFCSVGMEGVMWVPPYHDMGLVGGILLAVHNGHHVTLLTPEHFLQRPLRWLEAISRNRATHTAAPNFAMDLCVSRSTEEQRSALDLSCLRMLMSGGEPIRPETLDRFAEAFAVSGFDARAFLPAYGMAESTLMATTGALDRAPVVAAFDASALRRGFAQPAMNGAASIRLTGCGRTDPRSHLAIVDTQSGRPLPPGFVGEIWLSGPSIGHGYWNRPDDTREVFQAGLAQRSYLRTGDLGFIAADELFVVGRAKDVIIVHGKNHYPQDIEETIASADRAVLPHGSAAFGVVSGGEERLAVVVEVEKRPGVDPDNVVRNIRRCISAGHDLAVGHIALIRKHGLPKTTSGKVRRREARRLLLAGELPVVHEWKSSALDASPSLMLEGANEEIVPWLLAQIADLVGEKVEAISPDTLLSAAGASSLQIAELVQRAETRFGKVLPLAELPRDISVGELAALIAGEPFALARPAKAEDNAPTAAPVEARSPQMLAPFASIRGQLQQLSDHGLENPFFLLNEGLGGSTTCIGGREYINFASYNYLALNGHPALNAAAKAAIDAMGTSTSASRLVSGERLPHRQLEQAIAELIGTEACIVFVSGYLTNATVLGHLAGPADLIVRDALAHDSIVQGAKLSGAAHRAFPHNDWKALDDLLGAVAHQFNKIFIVIEGVYSMDGDIADLRRFIEVKRRHGAWLMIDEAHSIGVLGRHGRGMVEHAGVDPADVDLWMGTLSKSFASCGGYIAGSADLIGYLKYTAPGFVFSVGMPPPNAAAALAAIGQLKAEPERLTRLHERAAQFLDLARAAGFDTGPSHGTPIIPVILGDSLATIACAARMRERGISVQPIIFPAVEEKAARLRFFVNAGHTVQQITKTVATLSEVIRSVADHAPDRISKQAVPVGAQS